MTDTPSQVLIDSVITMPERWTDGYEMPTEIVMLDEIKEEWLYEPPAPTLERDYIKASAMALVELLLKDSGERQ